MNGFGQREKTMRRWLKIKKKRAQTHERRQTRRAAEPIGHFGCWQKADTKFTFYEKIQSRTYDHYYVLLFRFLFFSFFLSYFSFAFRFQSESWQSRLRFSKHCSVCMMMLLVHLMGRWSSRYSIFNGAKFMFFHYLDLKTVHGRKWLTMRYFEWKIPSQG